MTSTLRLHRAGLRAANYEPHQAEETIRYLIVGEKRTLLFDAGMGISDLKKVIA
ncbi:MAG TPA: hypothetical protein VK466_00125 [Terriglobales bacterium]|nr:hypothetical protein [Terriglobales bacterium]